MANARIRFRATCLPLVVGLLLLPVSGLAAQARNVILMIGDGMGPDGKTACKTIMELAKGKGMGAGLVTTSGITDATPAAFAAHVEHRSDEASVASHEVRAGVDVLLGGGKRFFLPERAGGKRKDGRDTLAFDGAVGVALDFQRKNPDTLLIVAADRETGGMALIERGKKHVGMDLFAIQKVQASLERILDALGKNPTPENVREVVKTHTAIEFAEEEARLVANDTLHTQTFVLQSYLGVGWASQGHTASPLFAFGSGPGSEELVGFRHNTELFRIMKTALEAAAR
jgi:alkaline phosphatase